MRNNMRNRLSKVTPSNATLVYGWILVGSGPARWGWGWGWRYPTGKATYLGRGEMAFAKAVLWRANETVYLADGAVIVTYYANNTSERSSYRIPATLAKVV